MKKATKWYDSLETYQKVLLVVGSAILLWAIFCRQSYVIKVERFDNMDGNQPTLVFFTAEWCGHCQRSKPVFEEIIKNYNNKHGLKVVEIDADKNKDMAKKFDISGYPTIIFFTEGLNKPDDAVHYEGDRTYDSIADFINSNYKVKENYQGYLDEEADDAAQVNQSHDLDPNRGAPEGLVSTGLIARNFGYE